MAADRRSYDMGGSGEATVKLIKLLAVGVSVFLVIVCKFSLTVEANGDAFEIYRGHSGHYEVVVAVLPEIPAVGTVYFSVTPLVTGTLELVSDAHVDIIARHQNGEPAYRARALNSPISPRYYETKILIEEAGEWTLSLTVNSDRLGRADFEIPFNVRAQSIGAGGAGGFVFLGVFLVLAGGTMYIWRSSRRRK